MTPGYQLKTKLVKYIQVTGKLPDEKFTNLNARPLSSVSSPFFQMQLSVSGATVASTVQVSWTSESFATLSPPSPAEAVTAAKKDRG